MRTILTILAAAFLFPWCPSTRAQEIKSPADVLPENTLAYLELRQPGAFAKEVASLIEGSVLANVPDSLARVRAKYPDLRSWRSSGEEFAAAGAMISPEIVSELGRTRGAAIAVTGIDKEDPNLPEFVAIILPGESNVPGFAYRIFAGTFSNGYSSFNGKERTEFRTRIEPIGEYEGVAIYRPIRRQTTYVVGTDGRSTEVKGQPITKPDGPALARLASGTILIGTPDRVKDVIRRAKSKNLSTADSLAGNANYRKSSQQLGERPGFFACGNLSAAVKLAEDLMPPEIREVFISVKKQINASAFTGVAASLGVEGSTAKFRFLFGLDPNEKTPILDLLSSTPINPDVFQFAPRDAQFVAALSNAGAEQRWDRLIQNVDQAAKSYFPNVPPPSGLLAGMEAMLGKRIGKDLLGPIETVAVAMGPIADNAPQDSLPPLALIARLKDEDSADKFVKESIPKIARLAVFPAIVKPIETKVGDNTIYELATGKNGPTYFYGCHGATLVLGVNSARVSDALTTGAKKQGFLANEKSADALRRAGSSIFSVLVNPISIATQRLSRVDDVPAAANSQQQFKDLRETLQTLSRLEEPLVVSLTRTPEQLLLEASYTNLKKLAPAAIDLGVEQYYKSLSQPPSPPK